MILNKLVNDFLAAKKTYCGKFEKFHYSQSDLYAISTIHILFYLSTYLEILDS